MISKEFELKLIEKALNNSLSKKVLLLASDIYLKEKIDIVKKEKNHIEFKILDMKIGCEYQNNDILFYNNGSEININEYCVACLLMFKRNYYIQNETNFKLEDIQLTKYSYTHFFVSKMDYEEYQYRFNFYYGLIDNLYENKNIEYCINVMLKFFNTLETYVSYENSYADKERINKYRIIKDKYDVVCDNIEYIINTYDTINNSIISLAKLTYMLVVNNPFVLQKYNLKLLYEFILNQYPRRLYNTQFHEDLNKQYIVIKWYNKEIPDSIIEQNINSYEVMYCYINYLYESKKYDKISSLFLNRKYISINIDITNKILYSLFVTTNYDKFVDIVKGLKNITLDMYITYKKQYCEVFQNTLYVDEIIRSLINICDSDEVSKIIEYENLNYELIIKANKNFNDIDLHFHEYIGKYDDQLIIIYQREIIKDIEISRGKYDIIPIYILDKFDKLNFIPNGKYYICEIIDYVINKYSITYIHDLIKYKQRLGI